VASTLDVWDERLAQAGKILVAARERLVAALDEYVGPAYGRLAGVPDQVLIGQSYVRSWDGELLDALSRTVRTISGGGSTPSGHIETTFC